MSTNSVIARQEGDTWRGRYVHWNGYPTWRVPELLKLVPALGGYEAAVKFLTEDHFGWSKLGFAAEECEPYTEANGVSETDWIGTWSSDDFGAEYAYVLNHSGIAVFARTSDKWLLTDTVRYAAEPSKKRLVAMECGANYERCSHVASHHFPEAKGTRYGTAQWLGHEEGVSVDDATAVEYFGTRFELTGSGGTSTADHPRDYREIMWNPRRPRYWWASVRGATSTFDLRLSRIVKAGQKLDPGIALVFPPTAVRGELVLSGTTLEY